MGYLTADDLFAGAGGWDLAALRLGIRARGVENMPEARATRDAAGLETQHDDVWTFRPDGRAKGQITSPPCQTFSISGGGSGRKALDTVLGMINSGLYQGIEKLKAYGDMIGDDRTGLVLTPLHFAMTGGYRWLAWEQVPPVLPVWEACAVVLRAAGWNVWTGNLQAEQYGDPQTRRRAVLIASLDHGVHAPVPTHSKFYPRTPEKLDPDVLRWVSMAEALDNPTLLRQRSNYNGHTLDENGNRERGYRGGGEPSSTITSKAFQPAATVMANADNGNYRFRMTADAVTADGQPRYAQQSDNPVDYDWPRRRPSTVVAGRNLVQAPGTTANRNNGSTKSRNDGVRVTVAEAGVLQSFPCDWPWKGKKEKQFLQAGNAVPVNLATAVLRVASGLDLI